MALAKNKETKPRQTAKIMQKSCFDTRSLQIVRFPHEVELRFSGKFIISQCKLCLILFLVDPLFIATDLRLTKDPGYRSASRQERQGTKHFFNKILNTVRVRRRII